MKPAIKFVIVIEAELTSVINQIVCDFSLKPRKKNGSKIVVAPNGKVSGVSILPPHSLSHCVEQDQARLRTVRDAYRDQLRGGRRRGRTITISLSES